MNDLFWITISCIKGVGNKTIIELYEQYPMLNFDNVSEHIDTIKKKSLIKLLSIENIEFAKKRAKNLIRSHEEKKIKVIPISSEFYPKYLRLIEDPPTVLYAKGNLKLLKEEKTLAIVGTREPTAIGVKAAQKIAATFAMMGYTIVSGLALGIDTAGHEGALKIQDGRTIAVLAGDLTQIYPAKNKKLAMEILERNGLWISETPIGQSNTRGNFVKRDRIQSGLSLGICPVQTPIKSGTQHTIEFARKQDRYLFTPIPLKQDEFENAVKGNILLIESGITVLKNKESYEIIHKELTEYQLRLETEHKKRFEKKELSKEISNTNIEQLNMFNF
ncbi:DNA-processing protein DprA [Priestia megaterium]|uniref:DNA-processing protein DprA n=1 Tax=Priestia megaterium TaxID=1404 RepID=UPI0032420EB5